MNHWLSQNRRKMAITLKKLVELIITNEIAQIIQNVYKTFNDVPLVVIR